MSPRLWRLALCAALCHAAPARAATLEWLGGRPEGSGDLEWSAHDTPAGLELVTAQWLIARGYFWSQRSGSGDTLFVTAGPHARAGHVHAGPDTLAEDCLRVFTDALDDRVDDAAMREALSTLVSELVDRGRPYVQVRLLALEVSSPPTVDIHLAVYSGPKVYAGSLVTGAERTSSRVFEREAGWRRGAPLKSNLISESEERLGALPYVAVLDTALLLAVSSDTADIYLGVKEASGVHAGGVLGWVPSSAGTSGYWVGEFDLQLRSAFGDGRLFALTAARPDPGSQRTRVHFWEPWPWGAPLWLGVEIGQEDFADDYIETRGAVSVRLATPTPRWQFSATWGRIDLEQAPSEESFPAEYLRAGIGAIDSNSQAAYRFDFEWSTQGLQPRDSTPPPQDRIQFTQGRFAAHRWLSTSRTLHHRALAAGAGTLVGSGQVPQHLLYRVGGIHSLRGFREQQFAVRDYLRLSWEVHLGSRQQSLFAFVDGAWLNFQAAPSRLLGSFGLGLRIAGRVSLLAGVPSEGGLAETKIHVGVTTGR